MLDIQKEIADRFNLEIKYIVPYKDIFILNTSLGKKVLKKTDMIPSRIRYVHGAKEYLYSNNFKNLDRYLCTADGEPFFSVESDVYTVADFIEGSECNFENREDMVKASKLLAYLHKCSKGFVPPPNSSPKDELGKLPQYFSKRLDEIKKLKKVAKKGRSKFDYLFMDNVDYFYNTGEDAIEKINNSKYQDIVSMAKREGGFCHHDYMHNNIICCDTNTFVINFDFCCEELKVYDLANLLRRKMRKCDWDIKEAKIIMDEYRSIENISIDEFTVMKLILQFPQKFWRVINKYYNSRRSWSEKSYAMKLQEVIDEVEHHQRFLDRIDELF